MKVTPIPTAVAFAAISSSRAFEPPSQSRKQSKTSRSSATLNSGAIAAQHLDNPNKQLPWNIDREKRRRRFPLAITTVSIDDITKPNKKRSFPLITSLAECIQSIFVPTNRKWRRGQLLVGCLYGLVCLQNRPLTEGFARVNWLLAGVIIGGYRSITPAEDEEKTGNSKIHPFKAMGIALSALVAAKGQSAVSRIPAMVASTSHVASSSSLTTSIMLQSLGLFVLAGFAEIGGGWLVWKSIREGKPWFWSAFGSIALIIYGFVSTLQPSEALDSFGRVYAVYGGFFIVMAALWGWVMDGDKPDIGDLVGCVIALAGVMTIYFWPRKD
eukprot:CAMPEP_0194390274 /NCGR_PEP_ID=MMETSP0174-20130528/109026_1 /TAXON_ID=216777 /ORGANISM="Proboscia alata, Strain PI-D3" /LENGTH=326 /DNA_ID=CAMNT_0039183441 /DNA_START=169 /DNA_END=1149 /DNA_ORIENTATION=+